MVEEAGEAANAPSTKVKIINSVLVIDLVLHQVELAEGRCGRQGMCRVGEEASYSGGGVSAMTPMKEDIELASLTTARRSTGSHQDLQRVLQGIDGKGYKASMHALVAVLLCNKQV